MQIGLNDGNERRHRQHGEAQGGTQQPEQQSHGHELPGLHRKEPWKFGNAGRMPDRKFTKPSESCAAACLISTSFIREMLLRVKPLKPRARGFGWSPHRSMRRRGWRERIGRYHVIVNSTSHNNVTYLECRCIEQVEGARE